MALAVAGLEVVGREVRVIGMSCKDLTAAVPSLPVSVPQLDIT